MDSAWLEAESQQQPLTPFETALHRAALYSNPAWNLGDQYHKKMQEVWVKHNRIQEASKRLTAFDVLAGVAEGMPKTVRTVIPFSRLAQYGDFPYDTGDSLYRSSVGHCRDHSDLCRVKTNAHRHAVGFGDFRENVVCAEEWFSENVEAMFHRLLAGPCNVTAESAGEETRDEEREAVSLNLSMVERSMTNGWTGYDSPFQLPSPFENWISELQTKPNVSQQQHQLVSRREHTASWANVIVDMYPKFLDTLRNCGSNFGRKLVQNVPLSIDFEEVLRDPVSPLETYSICPPSMPQSPLVPKDLLSKVILWDRVSAQSIKEIWMQACGDGGLLSSIFPTLAAILQQGGIALSTAYLADQDLLKHRLELGFHQGLQLVSNSDKGIQQGTSSASFPQLNQRKFRSRNNNCSMERGSNNRFRAQNRWQHQVFSGGNQTFGKTFLMPVADNLQSHKEQEAEKLKNQEMFPHLNAGGKSDVSATYWPHNNHALGFRLPWNVVAQLPNPHVWTNIQMNSPGSIVHQQQYLQNNQPLLQSGGRQSYSNQDLSSRKQFSYGNNEHRKHHKAASATTCTAATEKVIEILARPACKQVLPTQTATQLQAVESESGNPIPVRVGCNSNRKNPNKRECTLKLLTANLEEENNGSKER